MKTIDQNLQHEIEVERLWVTAEHGEYVVFTMLPISLLLIFGLWGTVPEKLLIGWFLLLTSVNFFRWGVLHFYHTRKELLKRDLGKFKRLMLLGSGLTGFCWVMGIIWFMEPSEPSNVLLICITLLFQIFGAVATWYCYLPAVLAISIPPILPLIALLFLQDNKTLTAASLILSMMAFSIVITSLKLAKMFNYTLRLNFENAALRRDFEDKSMQLETALENMGQGICMTGQADRLRLWNKQFLGILGIPQDKVHGDVNLVEILDSAMPPLTIDPGGSSLYNQDDGNTYEVRQSTLTQGGRVITLTDITDLVKRELSLKKARKEAVEANCAKIRFLATASHDLRQPIHALGLFFAQLSDQVRNPENSQLIGQIDDSIEAINTMLNALLDVSKLDAGIMKPNVEIFNLSDLFHRLNVEFQPLARESQDELRFRPVSALVCSDPAMLERILRNLIGNAIRYTHNGRILVAARKRGNMLEITIHDTGIGIPEDKFEEIFVEFHQLHNQARDRRQGLGLGLAIVKRLANLLQHDIKLASRLGRGSCFSLNLPLAELAEDRATLKDNGINKPLPTYSLANRRLLVLDDDIAVRESMQGLLNRWGCNTITAASLEEATSRLAEDPTPLDLLIVDYRLPGQISGIEAARNLQQFLPYPVGVLVITGDTGPERLQEAEASGYPLLHKPVQPAKLRSTLQFLLSKGNTAILH